MMITKEKCMTSDIASDYCPQFTIKYRRLFQQITRQLTM